MRKRERQIIVDKADSIMDLVDSILKSLPAQDLQVDVHTKDGPLSLNSLLCGAFGEARTLKMWAEAPSVCGECKGLAINCTVCGGRAAVKAKVEGQ